MKKLIFAVSLVLGITQGAYAWHCACANDTNGAPLAACVNGSGATPSGYTYMSGSSCHNQSYVCTEYKTNGQCKTGYYDWNKGAQWCLTSNVCKPSCTQGTTFNGETKRCEPTCVGTQVYNSVTNSCETPSCECTTGSNCNCEAHLEGAADFTFNIEAGGVDSALYVCEIGFLEHSCPNGSCGGDYIQFGDDRATVQSPIFLTKADKLTSGSANVYLNSLNTGSKFYVRYCLDVERKVVGTPANGAFAGLLDATLKLTAGNDSNYFSVVGLEAEAFHGCSTLPLTAADLLSEGSFAVNDSLNEEINTVDCLKFPNSVTNYCSWMVVYSETNKCLRTLYKNQSEATSTRSGMVHSALKFDLDFNCGENCGQ